MATERHLPEGVRTFFETYVSAYDALDAAEIASHYTIPTVVCDSLGEHTLDTADALNDKMFSYCVNLKTAGYQQASYRCEAFHALGPDACFVDLKWSVRLKEDVLVYKTGYLLSLVKGCWNINHATAYEV